MGRSKKKSTKDIAEDLVSQLGFDDESDENTDVSDSDDSDKTSPKKDEDNTKKKSKGRAKAKTKDVTVESEDSEANSSKDSEPTDEDSSDDSEFFIDKSDSETTSEELVEDEVFEDVDDETLESVLENTPVAEDKEVEEVVVEEDIEVEVEEEVEFVTEDSISPIKTSSEGPKAAVAGAAAKLSNIRMPKETTKRLRARKVRRVVRHIDPWSVLTFSVIFHLVVFGAVFIATLLILVVASWFNLLDSFESFVREFSDSYETFEIKLLPFARTMAIFSFIMVILGTMIHVLFAVLFNLISDLVGGIRLTVVEEDVVSVQKTDPYA